MVVRQLDAGDVETLRTIRLEALRTDPDSFGSTLEREENRTDDDWRTWLGRGATFVAEDDDGASGLVCAIPHTEAVVGLYAMFVSSRARGTGTARALVEAATVWAAGTGAGRVTLLVTDGNTPAIRLYESCGFAFTGRRESRDRDGATELEMARVIGRA